MFIVIVGKSNLLQNFDFSKFISQDNFFENTILQWLYKDFQSWLLGG